MWGSIGLLIVGFVTLILGGNWLVDGSSSIARKFKVSSLVIGLTIVAFGTSAPELIVNILASLRGSSDIAIGNVLGSNIANLLLILGITALVYPVRVKEGTVWKEIPLSLLAALVLFFLANDGLLEGAGASQISRGDGLVLLSFFAIFVYYTFGIARVKGKDHEKIEEYATWLSVLMILGGMIGLAIGGHFVVESAVEIAQALGLGEGLIGLTVVAIGTSLPELVTSITAALKKESDIAVGNVVGSNIFNLLWILGLSATIDALPFNAVNNLDIWVVIGASFLLFLFMFIGKRHELGKFQGGIFLVLYVVYISYLVLDSFATL